MAFDLSEWSKNASSLIPQMAEDDDIYVFAAEMFPDLSKEIECSDFTIRRCGHSYDDTIHVDVLQFNATKEAYQVLGLTILAAAFQAKNIRIALTHEKTEYRFMSILGSEMLYCGGTDNTIALKEFSYSPRKRGKFPFFEDRLVEFPSFRLECTEGEAPLKGFWDARDSVEILGQLGTYLQLAELLLDIARPSNSENEFVLEGPAGFQGVSAVSAEVSFFLPGGIGYDL